MELILKTPVVVPAAEAWRLLGEAFGDVAEWTSFLKASSLDGPLREGVLRTCAPQKGFGPFSPGQVIERLVLFRPETMMFEYEVVTGLPGIVKSARNRWTIQAVAADRCLIRSHAVIEFGGFARLFTPLLKVMMLRDLRKVHREMCFRLTEGRPHPLACPA
ncbi:SRPBCC family protein [Acanthopleuribacter pedis]|uniref:SRPBCC family protein n=1 Tax=Acanthopleuribacter pedis TaxID=442870 RepID=A0A8J7QBI9_9BACT|nr:SRPBCC family protein [Acanthopleuribacter pedis]MBO1321417.1 SRPBCC family protein [Acanthopleuribacter pedis]